MQQVKPGIYYEDGYLGVTLGALAFPHGLIMIDAPLRPEDARSWRSALYNLRSGAARVLVCLDAHLDRTLGARAMECTLITHENTAQTFRNRPIVFKGQSQDSGADWETYDDVIGTRWASPDMTFSDHLSLHWGGPEVILEHHPGPTPGAIWVHIPELRIVFVGDAVTPNQPPFLSQADLPVWIETLEAFLTASRDYLIISGRGGIATAEDVRAQLRYLKNIHKSLERLAKENAPSEATQTLVKPLLSEITFPPKYIDQYTQRLRAGLYHYYTRKYRQESLPEQIILEEDEDHL